MKTIFFYQTSIGEIGLCENNNAITNLYFPEDIIPPGISVVASDLLNEAAHQLRNYLAGVQKVFTLPLAPTGSQFMTAVWQQLPMIPFGKTRSYQEIAQAIGNPKASRAVGLANNRNPIPIFIPCHRVIGANGRLTGYRGGLLLKEKLLALESTDGLF